jgi:hypothetical protein
MIVTLLYFGISGNNYRRAPETGTGIYGEPRPVSTIACVENYHRDALNARGMPGKKAPGIPLFHGGEKSIECLLWPFS